MAEATPDYQIYGWVEEGHTQPAEPTEEQKRRIGRRLYNILPHVIDLLAIGQRRGEQVTQRVVVSCASRRWSRVKLVLEGLDRPVDHGVSDVVEHLADDLWPDAGVDAALDLHCGQDGILIKGELARSP
jgi:hypothetical protein